MRRLRKVAFKVVWSLRSEASRIVVEDYEDTFDALFSPALFFALTVLFGYLLATPETVAQDPLVFVGLLFMAAVTTWGVVVHTVATKVYFTERTAEPMVTEVSK